MDAHAIDWAAVINGNWNDSANWLGGNVPDALGEDAVLGLSGAYTVDVTNNFTHGALTISNPDATLALGSIFHTLKGDLLNNGTVLINKDGVIFNSHIAFGADAMIAGNGEIVLNGVGNSNDAQVISNSGFTVTHASGHTIRGAGLLAGTMINNGDIIGDSVVGGLELQGTLTQGAGGNAGADGGTLQLANGSVTSGGEFITVNGGIIEVSGTISRTRVICISLAMADSSTSMLECSTTERSPLIRESMCLTHTSGLRLMPRSAGMVMFICSLPGISMMRSC